MEGGGGGVCCAFCFIFGGEGGWVVRRSCNTFPEQTNALGDSCASGKRALGAPREHTAVGN